MTIWEDAVFTVRKKDKWYEKLFKVNTYEIRYHVALSNAIKLLKEIRGEDETPINRIIKV